MDVHDLFLSCRKGDIVRVKYLIEEKEVDLSVRDRWDTTPLYYACLCGHKELVKHLLANGARCEANTFDGERCLYGALNNDIRNLLKSYKAITPSTIVRDIYSEFLRRMFEDGLYTDVMFVVHGKYLTAHRCVLSARSVYFRTMFRNKWKERQMITLTNKLVRPWAFETILQYLYTGRLQCHLDQTEDITRLAKQCQLNELINELQENMKQVLSFESTKPGVHVTMVSVDQSSDLPVALALLVDAALPPQLFQAGAELPFPPEQPQVFSDVTYSVEGYQFPCHKAFFCGRSDYFKALLNDWSRKTTTGNNDSSRAIELHDVSVDVFVCIVEYVYQDWCNLPTESVCDMCDVLHASDVYLLPGLKRRCAARMTQVLDTDSVMTLIRMARLYNLPRLEDQCAEFIATNIEKMVQDEAFTAFVREDAASIRDRETTDTIPVIDDIRYHISSFMQTFSDMYEANEKLTLIDNFLEELCLDA